MYLFFDTETAGLPKNWKAPVHRINNWPRLVQVAWLLYDEDGNLHETADYIIKPEGFRIPVASTNIHGISTEKALAEGEDIEVVLNKLDDVVRKARYLVAHNMNFDVNILGAEFIRAAIDSDFYDKTRICTMKSSTHYCAIPGRYGYKWPTLTELHEKLFDQDFAEAHNALADIEATARCFWELKERGVILH